MKYSKISFAIGIFLLSSNFADASSMRCSRGIASEGDTRQEVIDKCGEPINKEIWEPGVRNQNTKTPKKGAAHVEFWTYGPDGGVYRKLRFIDDRLVQVEIIWK